MGKKSNAKKGSHRSSGPAKLLPQTRGELTAIVDSVFKRCTKMPSTSALSPAQEWSEHMEVYKLMERIREIEKDIQLPQYPRLEQVTPFMAWLKEKSVTVSGVEVCDYGCLGLGLRACRDLKEGQEVIIVPKEAMITEETARKSYLGPLIERDPILQHMGNVCLALHVLGEYVSASSSPWAPYLRILPSTYTTTLYFTPDHYHALKGSPALEEAMKQFRNIARQYSYFYRILHSSPEAKSWPIRDYFTFDAYRWAVSTVMTRQNRIPVEGGSGQLALIPAWDMANHEQGVFSTAFDEEGRGCVCFAQRDFSEGDQFTIHYSQRPNNEFFLHSGFIDKDNKNDSLPVKLGVSKDDPLYQEKVALLTSLGLPSSGSFMIVPGLHPISPGLLAFSRIFCMDKDSLGKWKEGGGDKAKGLQHDDCDVGTTVEDKTWAFLNMRVSLLLRSYPTKLEEDEASLEGGNTTGLDALIKSQLVCEKRILRDASNYLASRIVNK